MSMGGPLFTPISVGGITLRNRIVRSATYEGAADGDGFVGEAYRRKYEELARNSIGMIISGALLVFFNRNYQITVLVLVLIGMLGGAMWLLNLAWIDKNVARVSEILKERAAEMEQKNK